MTAFGSDRYDPGDGGIAISTNPSDYDLARLERVVTELVRAHREQLDENAALRRRLEEKGRRIRLLEGQLLDANQRRKDVAKRIDEMIGQLDHLDGQLGRADA